MAATFFLNAHGNTHLFPKKKKMSRGLLIASDGIEKRWLALSKLIQVKT